jgi:hypothetical protein
MAAQSCSSADSENERAVERAWFLLFDLLLKDELDISTPASKESGHDSLKTFRGISKKCKKHHEK